MDKDFILDLLQSSIEKMEKKIDEMYDSFSNFKDTISAEKTEDIKSYNELENKLLELGKEFALLKQDFDNTKNIEKTEIQKHEEKIKELFIKSSNIDNEIHKQELVLKEMEGKLKVMEEDLKGSSIVAMKKDIEAIKDRLNRQWDNKKMVLGWLATIIIFIITTILKDYIF